MKYKFEQLLNRSYAAIEKRGLINKNTMLDDFFDKIEEEKEEVFNAESDKNLVNELTDLANVCFLCLMWMGKNPIKEFEKVVIKNETRTD